MATMFPQTLGQPQQPQQVQPGQPPAWVNPYDAIIAAQRAAMQQQQPPMFTPEQVQERRATNDRDYGLGILGQLSGDQSLGAVGGQVLKQAMAARQPRVTERGTADPLTGEFKYAPEYLRERDEAGLQSLEQRRASAEAMQFEREQARTANEAERERQRQFMASQNDANRAARAARGDGGAGDSRIWRAEDAMRADFDRITKDPREELAATDKVRTTIQGYAGKRLDGQASQAVVILLNKFLDPGSVVREGEFDRVVKAQGLEAAAGNYINKIAKGEFLTPEAVKQIDYLAGIYAQAAQGKLRGTAKNYTDIARSRGLDPYAVVSDPRWHRPEPSGGGAPLVVDVGAQLGRGAAPAAKPQALPKSNPKPAAGPNRMVEGTW